MKQAMATAEEADVETSTGTTPIEADATAFRRAGEIVGNYRILRLLARGGLSEVYLGENQVTETVVAIKVLARPLENRPDLQKRLKVEAQIGEALAHPNIVRMRDAGMTADNRLYIVMDYVPGRTLREQIDLSPDRRIDLEGSLHIMLQITNGVRFAHRKGIYHRDLKPENVIVLPDGDAKIVDFGIAKYTQRTDDSADLPRMGTLRYLSPEQIRNGHVDGRADVYALGIVFYEMFGGRHPFDLATETATDAEMMARHLSAQPMPLPELLAESSEAVGCSPEIASAVWRVVTRCLAKDPNDRMASADELLEALCELARTSVLPEHPEAVRISHVVKAARARKAEGQTQEAQTQEFDAAEADTSGLRAPLIPDASVASTSPGDGEGQRRTEPLVFTPGKPVLPFVPPQRPQLGVGHTMKLARPDIPASPVFSMHVAPETRSAFAPAHVDLTPTPADKPLRAPHAAQQAPLAAPRRVVPSTSTVPNPASHRTSRASIIMLAVACGAVLSALGAVFVKVIVVPANSPAPSVVAAAPSDEARTGSARQFPSATATVSPPSELPAAEPPPTAPSASAEASASAAATAQPAAPPASSAVQPAPRTASPSRSASAPTPAPRSKAASAPPSTQAPQPSSPTPPPAAPPASAPPPAARNRIFE